VARERELLGRREDAHAVVGARGGRREDERRLRQVRPVRETLHLLGGQAVAVEHDRERVTAERGGGEDVDLDEGAAGHALMITGDGPARHSESPLINRA
jgi:hypothetical protein